MSAKCIVIEGLEGAGKSTAIEAVKNRLTQAGKTVVCTREPGGTPMAEAIRECVKHAWKEKVTVEAELMLMYAARAQLLNNVMLPNLQQGNWILADRHDMSSQAYQGGGRQVDQTILDTLRALTLKGFEPDLTLYLDVEPKVGLQRARGRGELDRIELEDISFFERTRARYLALCENNANAVIIDTMQPMEEVHKAIIAGLERIL